MIDINVPLRMVGVVTVECFSGQGELLHREEQGNLIVNNGWASLGDKALGDDLTSNCILGRSALPSTLAHLFIGPNDPALFTQLYSPDCDDPIDRFCRAAPVRTIVGASKSDGGTPDVFTHVPASNYWSLTRKRQFQKNTTYFPAGDENVLSGTCAIVEGSWRDDGWTNLEREASYIKEIGFCSDTAGVYYFTIGGCAVWPQWAQNQTHSGRLWNRVVLNQSIGFCTIDCYGIPDIRLAADAVIVVTLELRAYYDPDPVVQVMTIDGVSTTVQTRVQQTTSSNHWGNGFLRRFGLWPEDSSSGRVGESNVLPDIDSFYDPGQSDTLISTRISTGISELVQQYQLPPSGGNYVTGLGGIEHANFSPDVTDRFTMITVFDPKIQKTDCDEVEFNIRYTWSQA